MPMECADKIKFFLLQADAVIMLIAETHFENILVYQVIQYTV